MGRRDRKSNKPTPCNPGHITVSGLTGTGQFDDFATIFIDWLLRTPILSEFWQGYRNITTPDADLFAEAAVAKDHQGHWEDDDAADEQNDNDEDEDDEDDEWDVDSFASRDLELHLPQGLIDDVRARLNAMDPKYAATLGLPAVSPDQT